MRAEREQDEAVPAGTIVAGFDGRAHSADALALAARVASSLEAELAVAAVLPYDPAPLDLAPYERALNEHFAEIFAAAGELLGERRFTTHRLTGPSPAAELARLAEELSAEALVVASTHRGALGRVYPGAVGASLLTGSTRPVAVAPRGFAASADGALERIAVGFDGSAEAELALGLAAEWAARVGTRLELIAVASFRPPLGAEFAYPIDARTVERERLSIAAREASARVEGVHLTRELAEGDPARVLIERSAEQDLLVLGSRGYGPLRRTLLGGVSARVIREAACPVVVVPRGAAPEDAGADEASG